MTQKLKKILIIAIPVAVVVLAAVILTVILLGGGDESYRTIQVYRVDGNAEVARPTGDTIAPYESMLLEADDVVKTFEESHLYLVMDEDKYLMAGPEAKFKLSATGSAANSQTRIDLEYGEIVVHVTEPLSADSSFEIGTGNSTMAVRGTSFRVYTEKNDDGFYQTVLQVFEGVVAVQLIHPDGTVSEERSFSAGASVVIAQNTSETYFDEVFSDIDYFALDVETLEFLKVGIQEGKDVGVSEEEIDDIIENKQKILTVTFVYRDKTFATQRVPYGELATEPMLTPSEEGQWDFDFTKSITEDTTISWKTETPK